MARPLRVQYPGALYHVTNRGNDRKALFQDDADRREFLKILSQSLDIYGVILHSFVMMNNHWHLLTETPRGNLGEFMRHCNITYTSYYNRRHRRVGHLYQGRYKSFVVELDQYLTQVSRYIHLNPVKTAAMKRVSEEKRLQHLWDYRWSSLPGYIAKSKRFEYVTYASVLAEYGGDNSAGRQRYGQQIEEDLTTGLPIKKKIVGQCVLGSDDFIDWVRKSFLEGQRDRERPAVRKIHRYQAMDDVLAVVAQATGLNNIVQTTGTTRQIVMSALYEYAGMNNREIGNLLGVDYSTVSQGRKRLREKALKDEHIQQILTKIEQQCQG